ncbi:hypothetical protein V6Z11_D11G116800 [Gossypium hirsutum]
MCGGAGEQWQVGMAVAAVAGQVDDPRCGAPRVKVTVLLSLFLLMGIGFVDCWARSSWFGFWACNGLFGYCNWVWVGLSEFLGLGKMGLYITHEKLLCITAVKHVY